MTNEELDELLQELQDYGLSLETYLGEDTIEIVEKTDVPCAHKWVNVGFTTVKEVCKHCDREKR